VVWFVGALSLQPPSVFADSPRFNYQNGDNSRAVTWKRRIGLVAGMLVVTAAVAFCLSWRPSLTYQGRSLRSWLGDLDGSTQSLHAREATEAIAALGTNALPELVGLLRNPDSPVRDFFRSLLGNRNAMRLGIKEEKELRPQALVAFHLLGPTAAPAVPDLEQLLEQEEAGNFAATALVAVGSNGVSCLVRAVSRTNAAVRLNAVLALGIASEQAQVVVPVLVGCLEDTNRMVQVGAVTALHRLARVPAVAVPALIRTLDTPDRQLQQRCLNALGAFGPAGKCALPSILRVYEQSPAPDIQQEISLLTQIAPEAKTNLFVQGLRHPQAAVRLDYLASIHSYWGYLDRGDELIQQCVVENLSHPNAEVRRQAAGLVLQLFKTVDPMTKQAVERIVKEDPGASIPWLFPMPIPRLPPQSSWVSLRCARVLGGVVRGPLHKRKLALAFTGHGFAEGGEVIVNELARHNGKASFFLTGGFLDNPQFKPLVQRIVKEGHYLGPHSDQHLLYCAWEPDRKLLVTHDEFIWDLWENVAKITRFGVNRSQIRYFLPAYEHYNQQIVDWAAEMQLTLVNYTPGTRSNADYTGEGDKNFVPSQTIFDSIIAREQQDTNGLNGFLLLLHIGAGPGRTDKFHARFGELLDHLAGKGYQFVRVDELLAPPSTQQEQLQEFLEFLDSRSVKELSGPYVRRSGLRPQTNGDPIPPVRTNAVAHE
jgi:peptidoglycan/xylan/chitin deacetylase (PgdA/CDA1 family)/HEAT repeat protein